MSLGGSRLRAGNWSALLVALGLVFALGSGCKDGVPPYEVIPEEAAPEDYLPPDGVAPGITHDLGLIYRFDRTRFRLFFPLSGTEPRFIRRDSVLALTSAGNPGAPQSLLYRPDLSDPVLAEVYANPRLFGFLATDAAQVGFVEGGTVADAYRYFPTQAGNSWETNHLDQWVVYDSVIGPAPAPPTGAGMPVFQLRTRCENITTNLYQPATYAADLFATAAAGHGIQFHAWDLVSEREYKPDPESSARLLQRNPRFLWLSIQSLGLSQDPQASPPVTIDQCLDQLPAHLNLFPVRLCGDAIQEGDIYTTWTYLEVPDDVLRERLDSEAQLERGGRCGQPTAVGRDTLSMFPTRSFRLLCKFESRAERIVNQIEVKRQSETVGLYPITPAPGAVVEFRITMSIYREGQETLVQFLELWYLRDIGQVVRRQGLNPRTRTSARLKRCRVDGVVYEPQTNPVFLYRD